LLMLISMLMLILKISLILHSKRSIDLIDL
jgi:hypothetical protein